MLAWIADLPELCLRLVKGIFGLVWGAVRAVASAIWKIGLRALVSNLLVLLEAAVLVGVAAWVGIGAYRYGCDTGWSLRGLLTLIDDRWKGALILSGFLMYRTLHEVLARTKRFYVPWGDLGRQEPAGAIEVVKQRAEPEAVKQNDEGQR